MSAMYVLTTARDTRDPDDPTNRPLIFEQCLDQGAADLESVREFARRIGDSYGETKIARLVFEGEPGFDA